MPIHNVGYRGWDGKKTPHLGRWWIITETGVRLILKSNWVKRMLFFAWIPLFYWGSAFIVAERGISLFGTTSEVSASDMLGPGEIQDSLKDLQQIEGQIGREVTRSRLADYIRQQRALPQLEKLAAALESGDVGETRRTIYLWGMMTYFRYPQGTWILFLLGFIAPGLIARDVRSRAFLLYFSRPIGRLEYMIGKLSILTVFITLISTIPALLLYVFAVMMAPDLSVIGQTWDIPFRVLFSSVLLVLPTASLALMFSSLTHESRFASFAWFAIWTLGHGAWLSILVSNIFQKASDPDLESTPFEAAMQTDLVRDTSVLSLYNNLGNVQSWAFGFESLADVWPAATTLAVLTIVSLIVIYRRIGATTNI